jgi:hypothetical protein
MLKKLEKLTGKWIFYPLLSFQPERLTFCVYL